MGALPRTLIVVPCFNEAARLDLPAFAAALTRDHRLGFVFVDDGSVDGTGAVIERLVREWPERSELLRLPHNSGKAEAVRRGVLQAATRQPQLIGYWDADLATPLEDIPALAAALQSGGALLAIGSRVRMLGRTVERSAFRHYIGRGFATLASFQLRLPVYDTQCGAKLFLAIPETVALFTRPFRLRWCFDVELIGRFSRLAEGACVEVPVHRWVDVGGSKITLRQAGRILPELLWMPAVLRNERKRQPSTGSAGVVSSF